MSDPDAAIRAIAYAAHTIRPSWPAPDIERVMRDDHRDFAEIALATITAARNPDTRFPRGIRTTFPRITDQPCPTCEQRTHAQQPPTATRCTQCGHLTDTHHNCNPTKPTPQWHQHRRTLATHYTPLITAAKKRGDHTEATRLQTQWNNDLTTPNA